MGSKHRGRRLEHVHRGGTVEELEAALDVAAEIGEDFPDGAFMAHLENTVEQFNNECGTKFDPNDAVENWMLKQD